MRKYLVLLTISIYSFVSNAQNVGIGTPNPQNKLHVGGGFRLDTLTGVGGAGLVRHDANGVVYGIKFSGNTNDVLRGDGSFGSFNVDGAIGWLLNGNAGTNPATHFLGTTDNQPLVFKVNNIRHGYLGNSIFFGNGAGSLNTGIGNIAIGGNALIANTTGAENTAIGMQSLSFNSIGNKNTAVGFQAMEQNTTHETSAFGYRALAKNTNGTSNTAIGYRALSENTEGDFNTATGYNALSSSNSGANSAYGYKALELNTSGFQNTAVGSQALARNLTGIHNSAVGAGSLAFNTSGYDNSAFGKSTLAFNTTGYFNSGLGSQVLVNNSTGHDNTALGHSAMNKNTTASFNTSVGAFSLYNNKGNYNTAVGYKAMEQNAFGIANTAVGFGALQFNTEGYSNCAFGYQALVNNISGRDNTAIGTFAGFGLPNNVSNVTVIGHGTGWNTTSSNQVNIGNFNVTWIGGQTGWFHYSDKRIKNDIKDDVPGLSFITRLRPVTYHVDIDKQEEIANGGKVSTNSELIKPVKNDWEGKYDVEKIKMTGFFAQDVEEAAKALNYSFNGVYNPKNGGLLSLDYSAFVVPLVKAVQEQQTIIEKQQKQIDDLLKRIEALEKK